ncbi:MAG TPA: hypothetical protein VEI01_11375 [Terriglobales bacterium]|nr:hypothetical protein [Terriglobales bacterium]
MASPGVYDLREAVHHGLAFPAAIGGESGVPQQGGNGQRQEWACTVAPHSGDVAYLLVDGAFVFEYERHSVFRSIAFFID